MLKVAFFALYCYNICMKTIRKLLVVLICMATLLTCETDPLTGETYFSLFSDKELFDMSFQEYGQFLKDNKVVPVTDDRTIMVKDIGGKIKTAAEDWYKSINQSSHLKNYKWEYNLVDSKEVNAWCMPGGKIVVYTGILPVTQNKDALATVMGHEVAHALLNHGKKKLSMSYLQQFGGTLGATLLGLAFGASEQTQQLFLLAYGVGTNVGLMLPYSRDLESEADKYGLYLMAIAGYDPGESVKFWDRMNKLSGGSIEFLSTHPSSETRINNLNGWIQEAKDKAIEINKK